METRVNLEQVDIRLAINPSPYGDEPVMVKCPNKLAHKDNEASLGVYADHLYCFNPHCDFKVLRRAEALAVLLNTTVVGAIKQAHKYIRKEEGVRKPVTSASLPPLPQSLSKVYESVLYGYRKDRLTWLYERGLTDETIREFHLGHDGFRFTIPLFNESGQLETIRFRRDDSILAEEKGKYSGIKDRNGLYLYPHWKVKEAGPVVYVTEGELDAVRLWQEGLASFTVTNGAGSIENIVDLLAPYEQIQYLYIVTDIDDAGEHAATSLISSAKDRFIPFRVYWNRDLGKDVTELLLKEGDYFERYRMGQAA